MRPRRSASCWPNANRRAHISAALSKSVALTRAQLEDLRARHGLVVEALLGLRRRRQDRLGQALVLLHAVGQIVAAERAAALRVVRPDRRRRDARQVRAHHELDRQRLALARHSDRRIGHVDDVVRRDVGGRLEPERGHLVQNLALERNRAQHDVERADPVGRDQRPPSVAHVTVAHLALVLLAELGKVRAAQRLVQLRANHGFVDRFAHDEDSSARALSMIAPAWRRWCSRLKARSISPASRRAAMSLSAPSRSRNFPSPATARSAFRCTSS